MATNESTTNNQTSPVIFRLVVVVLLVFIWQALVAYAPLVPKAVVFLDDAHALRIKAEEIQTTAVGIRKTLDNLEKKLNIFEAQQQSNNARRAP